jgi:hypothetical protein
VTRAERVRDLSERMFVEGMARGTLRDNIAAHGCARTAAALVSAAEELVLACDRVLDAALGRRA